MKDKIILIEMLTEKIEQYGKTTIELYMLKAIEKLTAIFASVSSRIIVLCTIVFFIVLLTFGLALYLGEILGKTYYGFFIVASLYGLFSIVLLIVRKAWLEKNFNDYIINQIFKETKNANN